MSGGMNAGILSALMSVLMRGMLLVLLAYLAVCLYVFFRQRAMLYHPQDISEARMAELARETGMERWLDPAGKPLGWMTRSGGGGHPVLVFHGNAGHALSRQPLVATLREAGATGRIFLMDYPGYGSAPGRPSQRSLTEAAIKALDALPGRVIIVGESLGTGVAAQIAKIRPEKIQGVLLITPFDSIVSAAGYHYPWLPTRLLVVDRFDSVAALKNFPGPVALIVSDSDTTTPPEGARRLYEAIGGAKRIWEVKSSEHNDVLKNLPLREWSEIWKFLQNPALARHSSLN